jgi:hypothetical protein
MIHGILIASLSVLDEVARDFIRPTAAVLRDIVARVLGMNTPSDLVERCMFSIIGQCFYCAYAGPLISRLTTGDISSIAGCAR